MTERLYYNDCYVREFQARVLEVADHGRRVFLDRTAFYPTSGGQPFDLGTLGGAAVIDVVDEEDRVAHVLENRFRLAKYRAKCNGRGASTICSSIPGSICCRRY